MKVRGADFIMYPVSDLARSARFYRDILGLAQGVYSEEWKWAEFDCGNVTLGLKGGEELPGRVVGGRIALAVDDIHAAHELMKSHSVQILSEPKDYSCCWAMEIADPDGNVVILHHRTDGSFGN